MQENSLIIRLKTTGEVIYPFMLNHIVSQDDFKFIDLNFDSISYEKNEALILITLVDIQNIAKEKALIKEQLEKLKYNKVIIYDVNNSYHCLELLDQETYSFKDYIGKNNHIKLRQVNYKYPKPIFAKNNADYIYIHNQQDLEILKEINSQVILENDFVFKELNTFKMFIENLQDKEWVYLGGINLLKLSDEIIKLIEMSKCRLMTFKIYSLSKYEKERLEKLKHIHSVLYIDETALRQGASFYKKINYLRKYPSEINHLIFTNSKGKIQKIFLSIWINMSYKRLKRLMKNINWNKNSVVKLRLKIKRLLT